MPDDSYHTRGAIQDRAKAAAREERQIEQLTRIADSLETLVKAYQEAGEVLDVYLGEENPVAKAADEYEKIWNSPALADDMERDRKGGERG